MCSKQTPLKCAKNHTVGSCDFEDIGSQTQTRSSRFWATVCKTVRPMLSVRCPVCLSVLSVTLVYCGQTVGRIKMKLGMQVGLGTGHIVLGGDTAAPPQRGTAPPPQFSAHICCGQMAAWIKMSFGMKLGLGPGDFVLDEDPAPLPKRGLEPPNVRPMFIAAKRLDG